jgi:hypothetical protein
VQERAILERAEAQAPARLLAALPTQRVFLPATAARSSRLSAFSPLGSLTAAIEARRLFNLLPFTLIAGLALYAALPVEPQSWALGSAGAVLSVCSCRFLTSAGFAFCC